MRLRFRGEFRWWESTNWWCISCNPLVYSLSKRKKGAQKHVSRRTCNGRFICTNPIQCPTWYILDKDNWTKSIPTLYDAFFFYENYCYTVRRYPKTKNQTASHAQGGTAALRNLLLLDPIKLEPNKVLSEPQNHCLSTLCKLLLLFYKFLNRRIYIWSRKLRRSSYKDILSFFF